LRRFLEHSWFKQAKTKAVEPLGDPQPIENLRHVVGCGIIRDGFAATRTMDRQIPT